MTEDLCFMCFNTGLIADGRIYRDKDGEKVIEPGLNNGKPCFCGRMPNEPTVEDATR